MEYFPVNSQVGHFTGAGASLDNRSLLLTCWPSCPGILGSRPGWLRIPICHTAIYRETIFIVHARACMASVVATTD